MSVSIVAVRPTSAVQPTSAAQPTVAQTSDSTAAFQFQEVNTEGAEVRKELEEWLRSLDPGRESMLQYLDKLEEEFGDLHTLSLAVSSVPGVSIVNCVDPVVFEALGIRSLGHKL